MTELDANYFAQAPWSTREATWRTTRPSRSFDEPNADRFVARLASKDAGVSAVINIGASSLLSFLRDDEYLNAYLRAQSGQHLMVGGRATGVDPVREEVDRAFHLVPPTHYFFAAASLEGTGVRYYGEYCMALSQGLVGDPQIVDRDSYEILFEPLRDSRLHLHGLLVDVLRGTWDNDLPAMATLKVRAVLERDARPTTTTTEAGAMLDGEEFIEVHLRLPVANEGHPGFGRASVDEVRIDARDVAAGERLDSVFASGQPLRLDELIFSWRREAVERELRAHYLPSRVVTEGWAS